MKFEIQKPTILFLDEFYFGGKQGFDDFLKNPQKQQLKKKAPPGILFSPEEIPLVRCGHMT